MEDVYMGHCRPRLASGRWAIGKVSCRQLKIWQTIITVKVQRVCLPQTPYSVVFWEPFAGDHCHSNYVLHQYLNMAQRVQGWPRPLFKTAIQLLNHWKAAEVPSHL